MHQFTASPVVVPRHYLQVASDFQKLLDRIAHAIDQGGVTPMTVIKPLPLFKSWDLLFMRLQRRLPRVFHALSARILSRSCETRLVETVANLIPLEQDVNQLMQLRQTIMRYHFSDGWQVGQGLLLARVDRLIYDIKKVLLFFVKTVNGVSASQTERCFIWSAGFRGKAETQAYVTWLMGQTGSISMSYPVQSSRLLCRRFAALCISIKKKYRLAAIPLLPFRC